MQGFLNIHKSMDVIRHINKMKNKNHVIISRAAEKAFKKLTPVPDNHSQESGQDTKVNIIKAISDQPPANIIPSGDKLKALPLR